MQNHSAGDGGAYYHLAELETAARYGINVVFIVNNNVGLNQEIPIVDAIYGGGTTNGDDIWRFDKAVNFAKAAESLGCAGMRIDCHPEFPFAAIPCLLRAEEVGVEHVVH